MDVSVSGIAVSKTNPTTATVESAKKVACIQRLLQGNPPPHCSAIPLYLAPFQAHHGLHCTGRFPASRSAIGQAGPKVLSEPVSDL